DIAHVLLFLVGAFAMRGAGCTWNDIVDRDLDARVERTRSRPIPSGQVSIAGAAAFLVLQALVGLAVLLTFNRFAIAVGIASLAVFYTLAVALIALAGWSAGAGIVFSIGLLAFAAHLSWQIRRLDISDPALCLAVFKSNRDAGLILFAALVLDQMTRGLI